MKNTQTKEQKIAAAIKAAGIVELFNDNSCDKKRNAQNNLSGRTYYVDDGTLKYFNSRIVAANAVSENLIFWIIESTAKNANNTARGFRFVAFDLFGTVLERPALETMASTKEKARRDFWEWFNGFDTAAHYSAVFAKKAEKLKIQAAEFKAMARIK